MMTALSRVLAVSLSMVSASRQPEASAEGSPDLRRVMEVLRAQWASVAYLWIECESDFLAPNGEVDRSLGVLRETFWMGPLGRKAFRLSWVKADGTEELVTQFRQDGRKSYGVLPFEGAPNSISMIDIAPQIDDGATYSGPMSGLLWLLIPAGRPVHTYIEQGSVIGSELVEKRVHLTIQSEGLRFTVELDPERDYQPVRVSFAGGYDYQVTKSQRVEGHWFPSEGSYYNLFADQGLRKFRFRVTKLSVNEPVDDEVFGPPDLPDGVVIHDRSIADPKQAHKVKGGPEARTRLERAHRPPGGHERRPRLVASTEPSSFPWAVLLASASSVMLAGLLLWRLRR
jgi:hypothetical protein